jgi:predicted DNA-binding transcriptional regulator AlpA
MEALLTSRQVAELLGVHPSTLSRLRTTGDGPPVLWVTSNSPRYLHSDVVAWLKSRRGGC